MQVSTLLPSPDSLSQLPTPVCSCHVPLRFSLLLSSSHSLLLWKCNSAYSWWGGIPVAFDQSILCGPRRPGAGEQVGRMLRSTQPAALPPVCWPPPGHLPFSSFINWAACRAKQASCQLQPDNQRLQRNLRNPCSLTCRVKPS